MSRKFSFRLEPVRAIRERAEDRAKEDFAVSLGNRRRGSLLLDEAEASLGEARTGARSTATGVPSGSDLLARQSYLERAERAARAAAQDLVRHDSEVDARRIALASAARDRQVLERLKERRAAEHGALMDRLEGAALDEMALAVHRRADTGR